MAATARVRLGILDLSQYVRFNPDDKMDPQGAPWIEPAFSETPFSDGQVLLSTTVHNREQMFPVYLSVPPSATPVVNLMPNGGFEYDAVGASPAGGWAPFLAGPTAFDVERGWAAGGRQSLRLTSTSVGASNLGWVGPAGLSGIPVTVGNAYSAQAAVNLLTNTITGALSIRITWYTAAGALNGEATGTALAVGATGIATLSVLNAIAPANSAFATIRVIGGNNAAGQTLDGYLDNAILVAGATLPAPNYGDGDSKGWLWNGTPGNSTSTSLVGKDGLHQLMRAVNNAAAQRPLLLEWRDDSASASTFFDVSFVRFEPDFNFRRSQYGYAAGILHVYTSGYGHTGTTRVTATAAGTGIFLSVPIASVAGDAPAQLVTNIVDGGVVPSLGRIIALAPITNPSYTPQIGAASMTDLQVGATVIGASGADGSQYLALPVSPTGGASGIACKVPLPNPTIAGGDNRILAVVKSGIDAGVAINALDPYGNAMGATAVASMSAGWGLVDLGVCRLPTVGYPTQPKISILAGAIYASGGIGPVILASPAGLALNEIFCLPDKNLALILERGAGVAALSKDGFAGLTALPGVNDSLGNPWSAAYNNAHSGSQVSGGFATGAGLVESGGALFTNGALGRSQTGSIAVLDADHITAVLSDSMLISGKVAFGSPGIGMEEVRLFKDVKASQFVQARLAASKFLALEVATGAAAGNLLASVAVGTLAENAKYRLALQVQGPGAFVTLSKDDGGPVFTPGSQAFASIGVASNAAVAGAGNPALAMAMPSNQQLGPNAAALTYLYSWEVDPIPVAGALLPFDSYTIDGVAADSYRISSAGVFAGQKLVSQQRGAFPKLQPTTTSVAVIAAAFDQGVANDLISAVVSVRERYVYGR